MGERWRSFELFTGSEFRETTQRRADRPLQGLWKPSSVFFYPHSTSIHPVFDPVTFVNDL